MTDMVTREVVRSSHRTVFVVHDAPYPPRSGSPLRAWQNINILARLGPVHVFSVGLREPDATMPVASSWIHIDSADYPTRSAGVAASIRRALKPRQFPIENDFVCKSINARLTKLLDDVRPTIIVISHWHDALPDALRGRHVLVADTHNVESNLLEQLSCDGGKLSLRQRLRLSRRRRRERAFLRAVDRLWVTSGEDAEAYARLHPQLPPITVWPNAIDLTQYATSRSDEPSIDRRWPTIVYAGFFGYRPNEEAALHLIRDVFPRIRQEFPSARLLLIGKGPTSAMIAAARDYPGIVITGSVRDVCEYLVAADLSIVPLSTGGGTRLKLLEAFAARIAVVSTPKGAEGIEARSGIEIEIAEIDQIANRAIALLRDPDRCTRQVEAAFELVCSRYSWDALAPQLTRALGLTETSDLTAV